MLEVFASWNDVLETLLEHHLHSVYISLERSFRGQISEQLSDNSGGDLRHVHSCGLRYITIGDAGRKLSLEGGPVDRLGVSSLGDDLAHGDGFARRLEIGVAEILPLVVDDVLAALLHNVAVTACFELGIHMWSNREALGRYGDLLVGGSG